MSRFARMMERDGQNVAESIGSRPGQHDGAGPGLEPGLRSRSSGPAADPAAARLVGVVRTKAAAEIPIDRITRDPDQPREDFDEEGLGRLASSLKARGQLQPIRVRWDEGRGLYVIVCGERRWRAAALGGLTTMSCVIMDGPISAGELLMIQVVENALREDLRPIERARAYRALMDLNGWSTRQAAAELAIDQTSVVNALKLLELPESVQSEESRARGAGPLGRPRGVKAGRPRRPGRAGRADRLGGAEPRLGPRGRAEGDRPEGEGQGGRQGEEDHRQGVQVPRRPGHGRIAKGRRLARDPGSPGGRHGSCRR